MIAQLLGGAAVAEEVPVETLREQLAEAQAALAAVEAQLGEREAARAEQTQALELDKARLAEYRDTLASMEASGTGEDTQERIAEAQRQIDAIDAELDELDATIAALEAGQLPDEERQVKIAALTEEIAALGDLHCRHRGFRGLQEAAAGNGRGRL